MLTAEYIVYLCMYINISCICENNTVTQLKFGQQLNWIHTEGKSLIMKLGPVNCCPFCYYVVVGFFTVTKVLSQVVVG